MKALRVPADRSASQAIAFPPTPTAAQQRIGPWRARLDHAGRHIRAAAATVWWLADVREALRQTADECVATRPALAARLRAAARQGWAE